ncbi:MAG: hypothetical protein GF317_20855 [Candidatus Lokiarchaeota archaeon]|nr:hypothetical protein [Candidatus Lokiarchaeota archaeon]MBD3201895.1 hypothetical protein [Candidatus Lokiarchaeota archaeon]
MTTTISSDLLQNEEIRTIINSDYKNQEFIDLMKNTIKNSINSNSYYKKLVDEQEFSLDDLNGIEDLHLIPFIPSSVFKESNKLYDKLLKIPLDSPKFKVWNVSSCTTGDPSVVGRSENDSELLASMTIKCIYEFIPIPKDEWYDTLSFNFSPSVKFLNRIAMRYTDLRPVKLYSSNLHKISTRMSDPYFLIKFKLLKAIKEVIINRSLVGAFSIDSKFVVDTVNENSKKSQEEQRHISFGGSLQLLNNFMNNYMEENNVRFGLEESVVNVGGGGWSGHKSQLKYPPIDKIKFVSDCEKYFGSKSSRITDMYGFTETPVIFGSHWSEKHQDFIFHCPPQARVIIRDINSLEPLTQKGYRGVLEVLTPFGVDCSVNHAIVVDDLVELVSKNKCHECGYPGTSFIVHGRIKDQEGLGCSSTVEWI